MSILVTGGLGYIGSHVTLALLHSGYPVTVIDNLSNSEYDTLATIIDLASNELPEANPEITFHQLDIRDHTALEKLFTSPDSQPPFQAIIHLAGLKSVPESLENPELYYQVNVTGSQNLIRLADKHRVPTFIFSGSATVYGGIVPQTGYQEDAAQTVDEATHMYGQSKREVELLMEEASNLSRLSSHQQLNPSPSHPTHSEHNNIPTKFISLRYFNPVGNHPSGRLGENIRLEKATNLLAMVAKVYCSQDPSQKLSVFGDDYTETPDGTCQRDFIHVTDLAEGHLAALTGAISGQISNTYQVFNLGTGHPTSVRQILDTFQSLSKTKLPIQMDDRRPGDLPISFADPTRANQQLGWFATSSLETAIRDVLSRCKYFA